MPKCPNTPARCNCILYKTFKAIVNKFKSYFKYRKNKNIMSILNSVLENNNNDEVKFILMNFCKFTSKKVEDIMVPRSDINAVKSTAKIDEVNCLITKHSHARVLVYEDNLDNIIGFIHIKDLFEKIVSKQNFTLADIIRKPIVATLSMNLTTLLVKMQQEHTHIAIVVDEYGGISGIATNRDIIEALVGSIRDEHDSKSLEDSCQAIGENLFIVNARVKIEVIEQLINYSLKTKEDDFDTIGGLIIARAGKMPNVGSIVDINKNLQVEVLEANKRFLKKIKLIITQQEELK